LDRDPDAFALFLAYLESGGLVRGTDRALLNRELAFFGLEPVKTGKVCARMVLYFKETPKYRCWVTVEDQITQELSERGEQDLVSFGYMDGCGPTTPVPDEMIMDGSVVMGRKTFHRYQTARGPSSPRGEKTSWAFTAEYLGPMFREVAAEDFRYDLERITDVFTRHGFVVASHTITPEFEAREEVVILER
jgi:hypothetical protein